MWRDRALITVERSISDVALLTVVSMSMSHWSIIFDTKSEVPVETNSDGKSENLESDSDDEDDSYWLVSATPSSPTLTVWCTSGN